MFCLSVALNVRSCYETHYKALSSSIFFTMLQHGVSNTNFMLFKYHKSFLLQNGSDITSTNIHGVIYDAVLKDIHIMDSTYFINMQWNCLLKCLDFFENIDSFTVSFIFYVL